MDPDMREAIPARKRLRVTFEFLASGDSIRIENTFELPPDSARNIFARPNVARTYFFWRGPTFGGPRFRSRKMVAQPKTSHDAPRPYCPHYRDHNTFYVALNALPCCTKSYDLISVRVERASRQVGKVVE